MTSDARPPRDSAGGDRRGPRRDDRTRSRGTPTGPGSRGSGRPGGRPGARPDRGPGGRGPRDRGPLDRKSRERWPTDEARALEHARRAERQAQREAETERAWNEPVVRTAVDGTDLSARAAAIHLLILWDSRKRAPMEALLGEYLDAVHLSPSDRGFLTELVYGVVRHRNTLRVLSEHFVDRPLNETHRSLRAAIAIGLYQRIYLDTPPHAVVDATIEAWRSLGAIPGGPVQVDGAAGLMNAVLRRACESIARLPADVEPEDPTEVIRARDRWVRVIGLRLPRDHRAERLGVQYSHPTEMVRLWSERYDEATLRRIFERDNETPPLFIALRADRDPEAFTRLLHVGGIEVESVGDEALPTFRLLTPTAIERIPGYATGDFWIQDLTARRLSALLPHRPGASLLDLCAAPGGKLSTILDRGGITDVLACDVSEEKLRRLAENLTRLRFDTSGIGLLEVSREPERLRLDRKFDQVLVDAPCSNTGVLARRHEARWRYLPEEIRSLTSLQHGLLEAAVRHLAPGGDLLYTTCSLEPAENGAQVHDILTRHTELRLVEEVEILPGDRDGDGGYGALLRRQSSW